MVTLPGRGRDVRRRRGGPHPRRADDRAAPRAGLHGVPLLVRHARRAVPDPPGGHLRPALARPGDPVAAVPARRLRRRRRRGAGRARHRPGAGGRLLASAARSRRRSGTGTPTGSPGWCWLDRAQLPRSQARAVVLLDDDAGDAPAVAGRRVPGRAGRAAACADAGGAHAATRSGWGTGEFRSTSAWSMPEVLGELGRFNSADWIGEVDVPTAVVVTAARPGDPGPSSAQAGRLHRGCLGLRGPGWARLRRHGPRALGAGVPRGGRGRFRPHSDVRPGGCLSAPRPRRVTRIGRSGGRRTADFRHSTVPGRSPLA